MKNLDTRHRACTITPDKRRCIDRPQLTDGRQTGSYPETGFEEVRTQRSFDESSLPRIGLLAPNSF
jgi:hypothetical protein